MRRSALSGLLWPLGFLLLPLGLATVTVTTGCKGVDTPKDDAKVESKADPTQAEAEATSGIDALDLDNRAFPLLVWASYMVTQDYYDPSRFDPRGQLEAATDALGLHTPEFFGTVEGDTLKVRVSTATKEFDLSGAKDIRAAADVLEQVLSFVKEQLGLEAEPLHELEYAAINGFLAPLDANSILLTPEQHADLGVKTKGEFGGIGAEIRAADRRILVARVLPDSPAQKGGLRDGDLIVKIDEQSTVNMSSADAQHLLRGPIGTEVVLKVVRDGETVTVKIERGTIKIPSIDATLLPEAVGYVSIAGFQADTSDKFKEALEQLMQEARAAGSADGIAALVIDLRSNDGGLLLQATELLDQLVTGGELVIVHSAQGREHTDGTKKLTLDASVPVVALINEGSASAAEIVSGGIKHLGRGVVIGQDSFGKGTVQQLSAARPYGRELALKLTIAEYRVAGDRKINAVGVRSDVELIPVQFSEIEGIARYYDEQRFELSRMRSRIANHPSARHEANADAFVSDKRLSMRYLDEPPEPPAAGERPSEVDEKLDDPEIRIAREIAASLVGKIGRDAQLEALAEPVARLRKAEDEAIVAQARESGVQWSAQPATPLTDVPLKVELSLPDGEQLEAGEAFKLEVAVTNTGDVPAERVHLITECDQSEVDGIELLMGTLAPGERRSNTLELYFMPWHASLEDELRVDAHVGEPGARPDGEASLMLSIEGATRPQFAFDYWIVDDPALADAAPKRPEPRFPEAVGFEVSGNGDGVLSPNEHVLFAFEVRNDGEGTSTDTRAILRNLSGTQGLLEEGLVTLGELKPGQTATGAFGIDVSKDADPSLPFELDLLLGDGRVRESVGDKLRLRVVPDVPSFEGVTGEVTVGDAAARLYAGAHPSAGVVMSVPAGTELEQVGKSGSWVAVRPPAAGRRKKGDGGRRLWVPADLVSTEGKGAEPPARSHLMIDPPRIVLDDVPSHVRAERVTVAGKVTHPSQVRDLMIVVYPSDPSKPPRKAHYAANPAFDPSGEEKDTGDPNMKASSFAFSAVVPLAPGSNRLSIVARDANKVERRLDHWVYFQP